MTKMAPSRSGQEVEAKEFSPRDYQTELYEKCKEQNTIICLTTGAGKTFIAVLLIKHYQHQLRDPEDVDGVTDPFETIGKRSVFLTPVIPLVIQQYNAIKHHTHLKVGAFYGREWEGLDKEAWFKQIQKNQVLVMIPEIFRQILSHGFMKLAQCNLIIFDEVHHAVKKHAYREVMRHFDTCPLEQIPRILGLTASLINKQANPTMIKDYIKQLEATMRSACITSSNLRSLNKHAANPKEIICFYESSDVLVDATIEQSVKMVINLIDFMNEIGCDFESSIPNMPLKPKSLKRFMMDTLFIMQELGLWCAKEVAQLYIRELSDMVEMFAHSKPTHASIISAVKTVLNVLRCSINKFLCQFNLQYQLLKFSKPKLLCLLHLLKEYHQNEQANLNLCCIIFVERRSVSLIISKWLQKLASIDTNYNFLRVNYVVGNSNSDTITTNSHKSQEETLKKFRSHDEDRYNVLTATSVLEEGLDVPKCNLVIRFDFPKNFRMYVQSKGRARDPRGNYVIFTSKVEKANYLKLLNDYKEIELELNKNCHGRVPPTEQESISSLEEDNLLPPYMPDKRDGAARVTMNFAISVVNRYCLKLPSDSFTKLTPLFKIMEVGSEEEKQYVCKLRLPINSPVRKEIVGVEMPTKSAAKKAAALKACEELHKAKELDDNFLPVGKESIKCIEELGLDDDDEKSEKVDSKFLGTTKRRQYYLKKVADVLKNSPPKPDVNCYLYVFVMKLRCAMPEEHNTRGRKINDPSETSRNFGILTTQKVPKICSFPLFTRSGEVVVSLEPVREAFKLSQKHIDKLSNFHRFTFQEVLRLIKQPLKFEPENSNSKYFVVPIDFVTGSNSRDIDWAFVDLIDKQKENPLRMISEEEQKNFVFKRENYIDAVVIPWYRIDKPQFFFYVAEICDNLNPKSKFPDDGFDTFESYYLSKYQLKIFNSEQPLLDVDHTSARLNLLTPRYVNRKGITLPTSTAKTKKEKRENLEQKQILVPELCNIHPFPASLWRKAVCLPSILFRLNSILVAEQLRHQIAIECRIGLIQLEDSKEWPELNFGWTLAEVLAQSKEESEVENDENRLAIQSWDFEEAEADVETNKPMDIVEETQQSSTQNDDDFVIDTFDASKYPIIEDEFTNEVEDFPISPHFPISIIDGPNGLSTSFQNWQVNGNSGVRIRELTDDEADYLDLNESSNKICDWMMEEAEDPMNALCGELPLGLGYISGDPRLNIKELSKDLASFPAEAVDSFDESSDLDDFDDDYEDDEDNEVNPNDSVLKTQAKRINSPNEGYPLISETSEEMKALEEIAEYRLNQNIDESQGFTLIKQHFEQKEFVCEDFCKQLKLNESKVPQELEQRNISSIFENLDETENKNDLLNDFLESDDEMNEDNENENEMDKERCKEKLNQNDYNGVNFKKVDPSFGDLLPNRDLQFDFEDILPIKFDPLKDNDNKVGPSPSLILQALTMSNASDGINLERLETIGDSFLKYAITSYLYIACPGIHEGKLSYLRSRQISNLNLYKLGKKLKIGEYMNATKFEPNDNWCPPAYWTQSNWNLTDSKLSGDAATGAEEQTIPYNLLTQHSIPDKSIADCVEALIGSFLISNGPRGAILFMKWLGLKLMVKGNEDGKGLNDDAEDPIWHWLPPPKSPLMIPQEGLDNQNQIPSHVLLKRHYKDCGLEIFEKKIGYEFKDKAYLVQAFTHNSYFENSVTDCYQRLEFLGDAVLDYLITRYLYEDPQNHSPGTLTDLRSALVNNTFFASLSVKYEFHKFLKMISPDLFKVIDAFVEKFKHNDRINDCNLIGEGESSAVIRLEKSSILAASRNAEDIEVPKALGDIFESVAGSIYLDSGMSLDAVWQVYFRMMKPEIEYFSKNVPKSPIRELLEKEPQNAKFGKAETIQGRKVRVTVDVFGIGTFEGIGRNKRIAKCTAAKRALRYLKSMGR